ncbi:MAG: PIN domain-containing protein [Thermoanaerobaculia bacterium]|nr:PIN domain-containing protein [Thermoanaerobaculia bacterium]
MILYLADTSAWHRAEAPEVAAAWKRRLMDDTLATCAQVRLEILYSARRAEDYEELAAELLAVRQLPCGEEQLERALAVQAELARKGGLHHRSVKIPDLIVAASAEAAGAVVWHYDEDYDRIAEITGQPVEWIAPRGSL